MQALIGKIEIWRPLQTDSPKVAARRVHRVAAEVEAEFEKARQQLGLAFDATLIAPLSDDLTECSADVGPDRGQMVSDDLAVGLTLEQAYERYFADPTQAWSPSTKQAYETTRSLVIAIIGGGMMLRSIGRTQARALVESLRYMPRNATKLFPKLSVSQSVELARQDSKIVRISASNANAYLGNFSSFMNWAVNEELIDRNPAKGLRLPDEVSQRDKRHPFSMQQLKLIFSAPLYCGCVDGDRGWAHLGQERPKNSRYWVPLIALHTGLLLIATEK